VGILPFSVAGLERPFHAFSPNLACKNLEQCEIDYFTCIFEIRADSSFTLVSQEFLLFWSRKGKIEYLSQLRFQEGLSKA
jgi:hypothetical protein